MNSSLGPLQNSVALARSALDAEERRQLYGLIAGMMVFAVLELFGVAAVFPFLSAVGLSEAPQSGWLGRLYDVLPVTSLGDFKVALGIIFIGAVLVRNGLALVVNYRLYRWTWSAGHRLSVRLLDSYVQRGRAFYSDVNTSDLSARVLSETENVTSRFFLPLARAMAAGLTSLLVATGLLIMAPGATIGGVVGLGLLYWTVARLLRRRLTSESAGRVAANEERFRAAEEILSGSREIRLAQATTYFLKRFSRPSRHYATLTASNLVAGELPRYLIEGLAFVAIVAVVLFQVLASGGSVIDVLPGLGLLAVAAYRLLPSLQMLYMSVTTLRLGQESMRTVLNELSTSDMPTSTTLDEGPSRSAEVTKSSKAQGINVQLRDVVYRHPGGDRGIHGVSLTIDAGSFIGIRGATGSGKSTLLNTMAGFLIPQSGSCQLDGVEVTVGSLSWLHEQVGYVAQEAFVFDGTIKENVALGTTADAIDEERVLSVCSAAGLDGLIRSLPNGLDYRVGQRGARLSGGQRQRLGIAQALYGCPRLLLLDEATSALDSETEKDVLNALARLHGVTIVLVSHSETALAHCRRIYTLEDGRLVA